MFLFLYFGCRGLAKNRTLRYRMVLLLVEPPPMKSMSTCSLALAGDMEGIKHEKEDVLYRKISTTFSVDILYRNIPGWDYCPIRQLFCNKSTSFLLYHSGWLAISIFNDLFDLYGYLYDICEKFHFCYRLHYNICTTVFPSPGSHISSLLKLIRQKSLLCSLVTVKCKVICPKSCHVVETY